MFPIQRMQRYRYNQAIRDLNSETMLTKHDFIMPIFIHENIQGKIEVPSMPGIFQHSLANLPYEIERLNKIGVNSVILFGIPKHKDAKGSEAYNPNGVIGQAIRLIKHEAPNMLVIADVCLCEYTADGHCGLMEQGHLNNDATLNILNQIALSYAQSGVDIVAPSGMMDGMVRSMRTALDENGHSMLPIMSYAMKYASAFYEPFRDAAGSAGEFTGDRKHHQISPTQNREALRDALLDIEEGADYLMIKPIMTYLDMVVRLRQQCLLPIIGYHVSGEYSLLKLAFAKNILQEDKILNEIFVSMKRAGVEKIITYFADTMVKKINR